MARTMVPKAAANPVAKPVTKPVTKPAAKAAQPNVEKPRVAAPAKKAVAKPAAVDLPAKPVPEAKEKPRKPKLVRDSFTMPEAEYAVLGDVKKACLKAGIEVKKSELLRVGVSLLRQMDTARLKEIVAGLQPLKVGRPKKSK